MKLHLYIARRVVQGFVVLLGLTVLVFSLDRFSGSPAAAMLPRTATPAEVAALAKQLGLNKPLSSQYGSYLHQIVTGNLGQSLHWQVSVSSLIGGRLPASLELMGTAMVITIFAAVPLGIMAARKPGTILDAIVQVVSTVGISTPAYWIGLLLILLFAVHWQLLPATGRTGLSSVVLPAITLSIGITGQLMRLTRSVMLDVLNERYMVTARSKGLSPTTLYVKHALRNAAPPLLTFIGLAVADFVGGGVIIETIFAWPGVGQLAYEALQARDYPLVQGIALLVGVSVVVINLLVDLSYAAVNPRIRAAM